MSYSYIRESYKYLRQFNTELEQVDKVLERIEARLLGPERLTNSKFQQLIQERNNLLSKRGTIRMKIARARQGKNPWGESIELAIV